METTRTTKYFGDVELAVNDRGGTAELETTLNGQRVRFALWSCYRDDRKGWADNLPFFWEVVDKYVEINEKAKKAIIEYYDGRRSEDTAGSFTETNTLPTRQPKVVDEEENETETIEFIYQIKYFFSELFGYKDEDELIEVFGVKDFHEFDITKVIANIRYPNITIYWENGIEVCVTYIVSELEDWYDKGLCVDMDKELNVTGFTAILD